MYEELERRMEDVCKTNQDSSFRLEIRNTTDIMASKMATPILPNEKLSCKPYVYTFKTLTLAIGNQPFVGAHPYMVQHQYPSVWC
jgi:hypothetical protein